MKLKALIAFFVGAIASLSYSEAGTVTDPLMKKLQSQGTCDVVVELPSVMDAVMKSPLLAFLKGDERPSMLTSLMQRFTTISQAPFISVIEQLGIAENVDKFFITNKISLKSIGLPIVQALSQIPGPFTIREPIPVDLIPTVHSDDISISPRQASTVEWGVQKIGAPFVWSNKTRGENVVVAGIDTGVLATHEALKGNYGGKWLDAIAGRTTPYDDHGHGTHTMGTIAGSKGIGVAPGAKWIACKALGPSGGNDVSLTRCAEWILKQTPLPKVVCNSWGGGQGATFFNDEIAAWKAAGIIPVFAIGNTGPGCGTAVSPGDQKDVISVGATTSTDTIASFSSRGYAKGTTTIKPEVSAPGARIRSASNTGTTSYAVFDGTSMAGTVKQV
jgi:hypothetical protein